MHTFILKLSIVRLGPGTSSVARGLSVYLDEMTGNKMQAFFKSQFPIEVSFLADYPDFFSFVIVLLLAILLAVGVKESSLLNNVFTTINLATVVVVIVTGSIKGVLAAVAFVEHRT